MTEGVISSASGLSRTSVGATALVGAKRDAWAKEWQEGTYTSGLRKEMKLALEKVVFLALIM